MRRSWSTTNGSARQSRRRACGPDSRGCSVTSDGEHRARSEHARTGHAAGCRRCRSRRGGASSRRPASSTRSGGSSIDSLKKGSRSSRCRRVRSRSSPNGSHATIDDRALAVMVSSVLFETAEIVPGLDRVARACETTRRAVARRRVSPPQRGAVRRAARWAWSARSSRAAATSTVSSARATAFSASRWHAAQTSGHGVVRRIQSSRGDSRDANAHRRPSVVAYPSGAAAFAGATYNPTSHYRAAAVFDFHAAQGLRPDRLRQISVHQVELLEHGIKALDLNPSTARIVEVAPDRRAGFLAVRSPHAIDVARALRQHAVFADSRGDILRLGPAPYVSDEQLQEAVAKLSRVITRV